MLRELERLLNRNPSIALGLALGLGILLGSGAVTELLGRLLPRPAPPAQTPPPPAQATEWS